MFNLLFLPEATPDCVRSRNIHEAEKQSIALQKYIASRALIKYASMLQVLCIFKTGCLL